MFNESTIFSKYEMKENRHELPRQVKPVTIDSTFENSGMLYSGICVAVSQALNKMIEAFSKVRCIDYLRSFINLFKEIHIPLSNRPKVFSYLISNKIISMIIRLHYLSTLVQNLTSTFLTDNNEITVLKRAVTIKITSLRNPKDYLVNSQYLIKKLNKFHTRRYFSCRPLVSTNAEHSQTT